MPELLNTEYVDADITSPAASEISTPTPITSESSPSVSLPSSDTSISSPVVNQPAAEDWRTHLTNNWGLDATPFKDPSQAIDYSLQALQALQQDYQSQLNQYEQQLAAYRQAPQQVVQAAPAPDVEKPGPWNPPEFDPNYSRLVQMNPQTGLYEPIVPNGVAPEIVQKANARANWERQWQTEFAKNPYEFIAKGLEDKFKQVEESAYKKAVEYFQGFHSQQELQTSVKTTVNSHQDWLYQKDMGGNVARDAVGRPLLTDKGQKYAQTVEMLARSGVQDPAAQDQIALQMIGHQAQATQPASRIAQFAGTPAARNFTEALHTQNRNGSAQPTVAGAVGPSTTPGSFLAMAAETMREQGMNLSIGSVTPV